MRPAPVLLRSSLVWIATLLLSCGARTGLEVRAPASHDGGSLDASLDATRETSVVDVPVPPAPHCGTEAGPPIASGPGFCVESGFCWQNPLPQGSWLWGAWARTRDDAWAVGEQLIMHWDGTRWSYTTPSAPSVLWTSVWAASASDAWAVGEGDLPGIGTHLAHWDGTAWSRVVPDVPSDDGWMPRVWGSGSSDVWFSGLGEGMLHWDGARWRSFRTTRIADVTGSGPDDVWALADDGRTALHWDGAAWTSFGLPNSPGGTATFQALTVPSPGEAWTGGSQQLYHFSAGAWSAVQTDLPPDTLFVDSLWADGPEDMWAAISNGFAIGASLARWDGAHWSTVASNLRAGTMRITGTAADDLWGVGEQGLLWHWDGVSVSSVGPSGIGLPDDLVVNGLWGRSDRDVWAVGARAGATEVDGFVWHWDGATWSNVTPPSVGHAALGSVWGMDDGSVWVGGTGIALRWDGASWSTVTTGTSNLLSSLWGSDGELWAMETVASGMNRPLLRHWNGSSWSAVTLPGPWEMHMSYAAGSVWGFGPRDVYAAWSVFPDSGTAFNERPALFRWDGARWTSVSVVSYGVSLAEAGGALWGSAPNDFWVLGGAADHWDGARWTHYEMPGNILAVRVWGRCAEDVWAVGVAGVVEHWDGHAWTQIEARRVDDLPAVWAGEMDVWVGGTNAAILRLDR